ncbi:sulfite exporter TauE/SafE family protein [Thalassomonas viridans]|uniref:Probable membrane transporter protein n=1 Tax=Thalassomonas viridans TaxID=137584 RepID=A0AAE9Z138_9GAMM|nr:sulfite exporter TauE/SafE family protein [Thalassomonas viridans]WDE04104.1 sulfite exporter TauE/SafE family protein [Thalassomonas viridans]
MFLTVVILCLFIGAFVGFFSGLLGIGGGLIIVPALAYLLPKLSISTEVVMPLALATSLASIVVTSSMAMLAHHKNRNIPWPLTRRLMVVMALGALCGAFIADILPAKALMQIFALAVLFLACYMLFSLNSHKVSAMPDIRLVQLTGFAAGILSSLMGIAGGAVLVPVLSYFGVNLRRTIGIASACGVMVAVFGSFGYVVTGIGRPGLPAWSLGYVYLPALLGLVATSSVFAPLGVKYAARLPVATLKKCFALFLMLVAAKMLWP